LNTHQAKPRGISYKAKKRKAGGGNEKRRKPKGGCRRGTGSNSLLADEKLALGGRVGPVWGEDPAGGYFMGKKCGELKKPGGGTTRSEGVRKKTTCTRVHPGGRGGPQKAGSPPRGELKGWRKNRWLSCLKTRKREGGQRHHGVGTSTVVSKEEQGGLEPGNACQGEMPNK